MVDYGFETTDDVQYDKQGLPIGTYKVMAISEEDDEKGNGFIIEYEVVEGEFKGRKGKVWYHTKHPNATTANIAKQAVKRISDATGKAVSASSPIKNRVFTIQVGEQKKDPRYTEIKKYLPEDHKPSEDAPF